MATAWRIGSALVFSRCSPNYLTKARIVKSFLTIFVRSSLTRVIK